ncbi:hypothetical protein K501DRAFT_288855 [Backusella circina FSU 941]|nr:hypothetical protein K501DRAFT_288855 [Backusella circina FSU 941]
MVEPMTHWLNKLEEYDMTTGQLQLDRLMLTHSFTRITSLVVSPQIDILASLPNVPLLRHLAIFNFELDIDYLELIHEKSPKLTHFRLTSGLIRMMPNKVFPYEIQPLVNVASFIISDDVAIADKECFFLDYLCIKYPKLLHLTFLSSFKNTLLSRHRSMRYRGGDVVTHEEFESTRKNYLKEGESRFLSKLSNTITTLSLETSLFDNIYAGLGQSELNPTEIHFQDSSEPQQQRDEKLQFKYIGKLTKLKKLVTSIGDSQDPFTRDLRASKLEDLSLTIRRSNHINCRDKSQQKELDFGRLLYSFPGLHSLTLDGPFIKLTTNDHFTSRATHLKLRKLQLRRCITLPLLVVFLRFYGKCVNYLEWPFTRLVKTKDPDKGKSIKIYELNFPDHTLNILHLTRIPYLRPPQHGRGLFSLYIEVKAGTTIGKYVVEAVADDRITNVKDITHQTIDLTCDVIDLTDLPEENDNMTKVIITLKELRELKMEGYNKEIILHRVVPQPTVID